MTWRLGEAMDMLESNQFWASKKPCTSDLYPVSQPRISCLSYPRLSTILPFLVGILESTPSLQYPQFSRLQLSILFGPVNTMSSTIRVFSRITPAARLLSYKRPTTPCFKNPIAQYREFSVSWRQAMLSTELSEAEVSALRANKDRLAKDLHHSCQWGYGIRWGE